MSDKSPDRRVRKTLAALSSAMMSLLHREEWDAITIQMICTEADVARSSFYTHFDNKVGLLDHCIVERYAEARESIAQMDWSTSPMEIKTLSWLVDHIMSEKVFFLRVANSATGQMVFTRFRLAVSRMLSDELASRGDEPSANEEAYLLGGSFALIQHCISSGHVTAPYELKATVQQLASRVRSRT